MDLAGLALRRKAASRPAPAEPRRILVLGYAAIGDMIFFLPVLRELRRAWPKARITFVANSSPITKELIPATGLVDEIWEVDVEDAAPELRREVSRRIREAGFDWAVLSPPTPARFFAPALLSIPVRAGHCRPVEAPHEGWSGVRYALWRLRRALISEEFERRLALNRKVWATDPREHTVSRNLRLLASLGLEAPKDVPPELPSNEGAARFAEERVSSLPGLKTVGLHIGSPKSQYGKVWPAEKWGEVLRRLVAEFPIRTVLLGGGDETDNAVRFAGAFGGEFVDLTGRSSLIETFAVMRRCDLFLSNDTGLAKAAMALRVPTLTVWGPSDRPGYGIRWDSELHTEVFRSMPCAPCVCMGLRQEGSGVINFSNCGHRDCLAKLEPMTVYSAVRSRYESILK